MDVSRARDAVVHDRDRRETLEAGPELFDGQLVAGLGAEEAIEGEFIAGLGVDDETAVEG